MKLIITLILIFCAAQILAQKNKSKKESETYYVFDKDWKATKAEKAVYLAVVQKKDDTSYQWSNYQITGPLINIETYKDENATILNGYVAYFDLTGKIDSSGYTANGKKDSTWYVYDDTLGISMKYEYKKGVLIDSVNLYEKRKEDEKNGYNTLKPGEKEADYPGGSKAWIKYLIGNYQYPDRAKKIGILGTTKTLFTVETDGKTSNFKTLQSVEFSLDKEAIRLIENAPKWIPAIQDGRKVKAFRIQPITFGG